MQRGHIVLVPFPFTDLSATKKRPALIVSSKEFRSEDAILCAITSQVPEQLGVWDVSLNAHDLIEETLPKPSIIRTGKLFTMHRSLLAGEYGALKKDKLAEVLGKLQALFN